MSEKETNPMDPQSTDINHSNEQNPHSIQPTTNPVASDEIDLVELAKVVWLKRKMILRNTAIGAVIGLIVAFSIPKEYQTTVKMAPENSGQTGGPGNMGALAAMAGINIGGSGTDGLTPSLYPDIVASTPFLMEFKEMKVTTLKDKETYTLYEYLTEHQKSPWWSYLIALPGKAIGGVLSLFSDKIEDEKVDKWNVFHLKPQQQGFIGSLSSKINVSEDKKSGVIMTTVQMQDPQISAELADSVVVKLQDYMINYKTEKSRKDLAYVEKLYNDAQKRYFNIQKQYAQYEDANKNVVSASYAIEKARLQNESTLAFSVYNGLAQQVEMAKAKVQQDTPVLTILEPARISLFAEKPNKKIILIAFVFLGCFLSIGYCIIKDLFKNGSQK